MVEKMYKEKVEQKKYAQQRDARRVQMETGGTSRFGSGGEARFKALFREVVGRAPTRAEVNEGKTIKLSGVLARLESQGVPIQQIDPHRVGPPLLAQTGVEEDEDEDDEDYNLEEEEEWRIDTEE